MNKPLLDARARRLIDANGLDADALPANRRGELTPVQQQRVRRRRRAWSSALLVFALLLTVFGIRDLLPGRYSVSEGSHSDALLALLLGVALLALRFSSVGRSHAATIAAGKVCSIDGFVRVDSSTGDGHTAWRYRIDGRDFDTTEDGAKAIDARSRYRVYYLPGTDIMVNLEAIDPVFAGGDASDAPLDAAEVGAIVGELMRLEHATSQLGSAAWPGMVFSAFASATSGLRVVVGFVLGAQGGSGLDFYRRLLGRGPGSRAVSGLGDEAVYRGGQLLVRRGDVFVSVNLVSSEDPAALFAAERSFDIARRIAALALQRLHPPRALPTSQGKHP